MLEHMRQVHGLRWMMGPWLSIYPEWTVDLSEEVVEELCREYLLRGRPRQDKITKLEIRYLTAGAFNRVYVVNSTTQHNSSVAEQRNHGNVQELSTFKLAFRVTLPIHPGLKSLSEVATIKFLQGHTTVPVVSVLDSTHHQDDRLGFEWMIQSFSPGRKLGACWDDLDDEGRERMIKQLVGIQHGLFNKARFKTIGSIFPKGYDRAGSSSIAKISAGDMVREHEVGKLVTLSTMSHFNTKGLASCSRGPYRNTVEWLLSHLDNVALNCEIMAKSSEEGDREFSEAVLPLVQRLRALVPKVFHDVPEVEDTVLIHHDLNHSNIFCNDNGTIASIIDWECTACLPFWVAYDIPEFLKDRAVVDEKPDPTDESYKISYKGSTVSTDAYLRDVNDWQHFKMKELYVQTMECVWPEWAKEYGSNQNQARHDLRNAVESCDSAGMLRRIRSWLDQFEALEEWRFYQELNWC